MLEDEFPFRMAYFFLLANSAGKDEHSDDLSPSLKQKDLSKNCPLNLFSWHIYPVIALFPNSSFELIVWILHVTR